MIHVYIFRFLGHQPSKDIKLPSESELIFLQGNTIKSRIENTLEIISGALNSGKRFDGTFRHPELFSPPKRVRKSNLADCRVLAAVCSRNGTAGSRATASSAGPGLPGTGGSAASERRRHAEGVLAGGPGRAMPAAHLTRGRETCWPRGSCVCAERRRGCGRGWPPAADRASSCPGFGSSRPRPAPSRGSGGGGSQPGLRLQLSPFLGASRSSPSFSKAERLPEWISLLRKVRRGECPQETAIAPCEGPRRGGGTRNKRQRGPGSPRVLILLSSGRPPPHPFLLSPSEGSDRLGPPRGCGSRRGLTPCALVGPNPAPKLTRPEGSP